MINIQKIDDNECFKWCIVRRLNPADHYLAVIRKADKDFAKKLDFKDIKVRHDHKIGRKNSINITVFVYENKEKHSSYVLKKCCAEKHVDLLLTEEKGKRHHFLIKYFNRFTYNHTLHRRKNHFCRYCLQAFSTEEDLKSHIEDCFKINGKQNVIMSR